MRRIVACMLALLLLTASVAKLWSKTRYPQPAGVGWWESPSVSTSVSVGEAAVAVLLLAGHWPRAMWLVAVTLFGSFALVASIEIFQGKDSCGCFGAVQVRPVYTMALDLVAVAGLLATGRPNGGLAVGGLGLEVEDRGPGERVPGSERRRWMVAGGVALAWYLAAAGIWMSRPAVADAVGQDFGKAGALVVLEPEKWAGRRFTLAEHIDSGAQLDRGRWIILLVHHDCDHCAAAVPRYVAAFENSFPDLQPPTANHQPALRLAVIEMPPFNEGGDPPPCQLPSNVLAGRLDESRDWFATTPVALLMEDGFVIEGKEGSAAEEVDATWWKR